MSKLPSGEQPDDKSMKHQKVNCFIHVKLWKTYRKSTCCFKKWKPSLAEQIQICVRINNFCLKCFDFTLPRTLRNTVLRETTRILQNLRTSLIFFFCPMLWLAINKGTAVRPCIVISWQPSQTYSAALQSLWPASRDQCSDTVWPRRSVSFTVCQRPQNFLAFITISWRQISGEFSHGTWLLHFRNSSESIRKNHDCNRDRHTR